MFRFVMEWLEFKARDHQGEGMNPPYRPSNLFLDLVPSSSASFTRVLRGQPRRLYTQGHAKPPQSK